MADPRVYDVIVVGGGIAGSTLGGVLARAGLGVLILEKEARFRDRVRGEGTYPYGVNDARAIGLDELLEAAGTVPLKALQFFEHKQRTEARPYAPEVGPALSFCHTRFQEAAFTWAATQGATTLRPAKGVALLLQRPAGRHGYPRRRRDDVWCAARRRRGWQTVGRQALDGRRHRDGSRAPPVRRCARIGRAHR